MGVRCDFDHRFADLQMAVGNKALNAMEPSMIFKQLFDPVSSTYNYTYLLADATTTVAAPH